MKTKQCTKCKKVKTLNEFYKNKCMKDGYTYWCKKCTKEYRKGRLGKKREYDQKYREKNRGKIRKWDREHYKKHQEDQRERSRKHYRKNKDAINKHRQNHYRENINAHRNARLQRTYGISIADYDEMLEAQNGVCVICGMTPEENGRNLDIDHDHITGKVRALLCGGCNRGLGGFRDNPEICRSAMFYLYEYGKWEEGR